MARYDFIAVYILASARNGTLYTGVTSDLVPRIHLHRTGHADAFTKRHGCTTLVWWERFADMRSAIAREKELKKWKRNWKIALIEKSNPQWLDLYPNLAG